MRSVKQTAGFRRDLKRESKGRYRMVLKNELYGIVETLANDLPLDERYRDYALTGNRRGLRECHIRPDLLLVSCYENGELNLLVLLAPGSHSEVLSAQTRTARRGRPLCVFVRVFRLIAAVLCIISREIV